ncbi:MDR family MFS transporter [Actinomycetospora cinnamomea]|uniref:DHA2 family lincomycin resistance protein-like MFS transporter n=1 Tax=Actinomycetospora cinnamomea TaxID=663609 RepID=A0A2U1FS13_9PSEU|nr:MDR family MFS transporter [Actinomycetospora cinnamomea]PVZ14949.1 DHA2 family lincomycin resistance protein-like MFS transporter [Actinomycetospora cinnamomea]
MTAPSTAGTDRGDTSSARPMVIIAMLVVSAFVMILNETILSVALPHLTGDLGVSATTVQWLTSGFLLTMGVVIPTTGFLLDRFTPRQIFLAAMTLFSAGTLVCALSPGFPLLLTGRVVQASGTAVMIPLLMTSVMRLIPADRRGATMGTISIVIAVAPAIGPTIGGLILSSLDWRWMFWSVLPLSIAALVVGSVVFRLSDEKRRSPLDLLSVLLSALGFGGIVYGFSTLGHGGDAVVPPWAALVVGVVALAVFIARQLQLQRSESALLDLRPFGHRPFVVAVVLAALLFMTLLGAGAILLPIYLQNVLGVSAAATGLAVLPGGLVLGFMGRPVGRVFDRVGARPLVIPGAIGMAVSMWLFAALGASAALWMVVVVHVLLMASLGLMMTPLLTEGLAVLPERLYSHGSAIMATLQQVAGAAGTAGFVTVAAIGSAAAGGTPDAAGLRLAFMVAGVIGVIAVGVAFMMRRRPAGDAPGGGSGPEADQAEPAGEVPSSTPVAGH